MEEARVMLCSCFGEVVIILARDATKDLVNNITDTAPVERRRRRKLPQLERPRSAPIYDEDWSSPGYRVFQDSQTEYRVSQKIGLKTVIHISSPESSAQSVPATPRIPHYPGQSASPAGVDKGENVRISEIVFKLCIFSREKNQIISTQQTCESGRQELASCTV